MLRVAEHVHEVENVKLGWREPKSDGRKGGGNGKTDIYLSQIGGELFGYAAPDSGQATKTHRLPRRLHGYLVLDNDYSPFEFPHTSQLHDLEVTLAHEYNHILQFNYDAFQDPWFAESTATWMEDQVYNGINDYLRYVGRWVHRYDTPLTTSSIKEYGSAVWNQWLAHHYGASIIRKAWAGALHSHPGGFSVNAYETAIRRAGHAALQPRVHPLRRRRRRVAHRQGLPRERPLPRHAAPGPAAARRAAAQTPPQPHHLHPAARPAAARAAPSSSASSPRAGSRPGSPWSAASAARSTAASSDGSPSAAAAAS